jgi:hypothetical protein
MTTSVKGASRRLPAVTMSTKIGPHRDVARPSPMALPRSGTTKPAHTWPAQMPFKAESGLAKRGAIGSQPSTKAPSR